MSDFELLRPEDVNVDLPPGLRRIVAQGLVDLTPWHILPREQARARLAGLRARYATKGYVPFARRQDNDDVACLDPESPGAIVIVHDYAGDGTEARRRFTSFWDWLRAAIDDMEEFE